MKYCTRCLLPESHESISFDDAGVCGICRQAEIKRHNIDWPKRREALNRLVAGYKGKDTYDCIVPFSGGKDSTFQLWFVVTQLKLRPLVVNFNHWGYRPQVYANNTKTLKKLGVDALTFTPNWKIVRMMMLASLKETGDFCWHCHAGVFAHTMQIAVRYEIPLVIFGESSSEYRSYHTAEEMEEFDEKAFKQMINLGIDADKMYELLDRKVDKRDLAPYQFPQEEQLARVGVRAIYLGNYIKWDTKRQVQIIKEELDWKGQPVEGIPPEYDYEKIECQWQGVRDYCKYIKRGHGRTNHLVSMDIRNGQLSRERGVQLCAEYDGKRPASLDHFLDIIGLPEAEFEKIVLANSVVDWGFDHDELENGAELADSLCWDRVL